MPPSLNDVALACGVSKMTVSRALRGLPKVSPELAARIRRTAEDLGYELDPWVSRSMAAARISQSNDYRETIAFIWTGRLHYARGELRGAQDQARDYRFRLDEFRPVPEGLSGRRMAQILIARGIRGVILAPNADRAHPHYWLPWKHFGCVLLGSSLRNHGHLRVQHDHYNAAIQIMQELRHQGYRRPALICTESFHERTWRCYGAAIGTYGSGNLAPEDSVYLVRPDHPPAEIAAWHRRRRPDVLLLESGTMAQRLEAAGLEIPGKVPALLLSLGGPDRFWAGILQDSQRIGQEAVRALAWKLQTQELGVTKNPPVLSIPGIFRPGHSLPRPRVT
jgi:LacI family transcriptional regulator